jgi:hypothetical protein
VIAKFGNDAEHEGRKIARVTELLRLGVAETSTIMLRSMSASGHCAKTFHDAVPLKPGFRLEGASSFVANSPLTNAKPAGKRSVACTAFAGIVPKL